MSQSSQPHSLHGPSINRRRLLAGSAALAAGLAAGMPGPTMAASKPIDLPGAVGRIAAPFAKNGFNGGLGGLFYTPLGGTLVGGLTADEGSVIADGFRAGFYLPLFESNVKGASGKGYDAFFFLNGLLYESDKQAIAAGAALLGLVKPDGVKTANETLANGVAYTSFDWTGAIDGFDAPANLHRAVATAGKSLIVIDWEDFKTAQSDAAVSDLKASVAAAIDASRTGIPLAEAVTRIDDTQQVVLDILKCDGVPINGQSSPAEENKALAAFAKHADDFVRSTGSLSILSNGKLFTVAMETLVFANAGGAKSFFASRRSLIKTIDSALGRSRVKGEPEAGIDGVDETTGDFYVQARPDGSVLGGEVTVRIGARVISMAIVNAGQTLPDGVTSPTDAGSDALAEVAALATSTIQALKLGQAGDSLYDAGFGRAIQSGAL